MIFNDTGHKQLSFFLLLELPLLLFSYGARVKVMVMVFNTTFNNI